MLPNITGKDIPYACSPLPTRVGVAKSVVCAVARHASFQFAMVSQRFLPICGRSRLACRSISLGSVRLKAKYRQLFCCWAIALYAWLRQDWLVLARFKVPCWGSNLNRILLTSCDRIDEFRQLCSHLDDEDVLHGFFVPSGLRLAHIANSVLEIVAVKSSLHPVF